jgi:3-hydroxy-3-methylglutaryl CoA synthase
MAGILDYGAYIPRLRLTPETRNWAWPATRAVANFDEDAVTIAVAAARDCLRGHNRSEVDRLYFASTTAPYAEKQASSLVATALSLKASALTVDVAHSLRGGTSALRLGLDAVAAGSATTALVAAGDQRLGDPASDIERHGGDAAAALLVGEGEVLAEVIGVHSVVNEILDAWRPDGERTTRVAPDHFRFDFGYYASVQAAVAGLVERTGVAVASIPHVALSAPDARRHREAMQAIGASDSAAPLVGEIGSSGAALGPLELIAALERAEPGEHILVVNYGDGADALLLQAQPALKTRQDATGRTLAAQLSRAAGMDDYLDYLRWRKLFPVTDDGAAPRAAAPSTLYREQEAILRFHGAKCQECDMVQFPAQRVCARCQERDKMDEHPLADLDATLFSYSLDYVARTPDVPLVHGVVDFDGGGRAMMMLTDRRLDEIVIGLPLEPTFRKLSMADGIHNYLWKMMPRRNGH